MKRTSTTALLTSVLFTTSQSRHSNRRVVRKTAASSSPGSSLLSSPSSSASVHHEPSKASPSTLFGCGTSLASAIANLSPNSSLCPSGLDSDCPNNQYCYAGLVSANDEAVHSQLLKRQAEMEREIMNAAVEERQEEQSSSNDNDDHKFVCGVSWEQAVESVCHHHSSLDSSSPSSPSRQEPIYCPTGGDSACPSNMSCYASVSCSSTSTSSTTTPSQVDSNPLHSRREVPIFAKYYEMVQNLSIASSQGNDDDDAAVSSWYSSLLDSSSRLGWNGLLSFGSC